jgi:ubiquinone/menaquinone biosynthesis C-methylase UbiE
METPIIARYDTAKSAANYRRKYERSLLRRLSNRRELAILRRALARAGAKGRILDCPCGAGRLVPTLLSFGNHVTAVDLSAPMVIEAKNVLAPLAAQGLVEFGVAPVDALPYEDGSFDTVVCHRLIHHMRSPAERGAAFRELARVARRRVVLSFSDATTLKARFRAWRGVTGGNTLLCPEDLVREAAVHGLRMEGAPLRLNGGFSLIAVAVFRVRDMP